MGLKIIQTADVQVKNRDKNLYKASNEMLLNIETTLEFEKADIYIISGDLFEYATPTEAERKLIYNHISRVLNIDTVKELVIIAGNHDLLKDKKQSEATISYNPINIFDDFLKSLDPIKAEKLNYMSQSRIYTSKVSDKIEYYCYSLEDNMEVDFSNADENKFKIVLFHGMIKEFIDSKKLPIRKDIYNSLVSIEQFPHNSLIAAGDIHMNLRYEGLNGQVFYYPGSPMQHTHKEGSYYKIGETIEAQKAETKSLKCFHFLNDYKSFNVSDLELPNTVEYIDIELDTKLPFSVLLKTLENVNTIFSDVQTFLKVKSSNIFVQYEMIMFNYLCDVYKQISNRNLSIHFEYDKLVQTNNTVNNKVIREIIEEKEKELHESNPGTDISNLQADNIDELLLSDKQLIKLFGSVLDSALKGVDDSDVSNQELSNDIRALFEKEITNFTVDSKRYNILLESIETNGFMSLTSNRIELDIPGITRILGTNGIGKTTLYNMIRWVVKGEVYPDMSKQSVMKNNLIVFHKEKPENDFVLVKLNMNVNGLKVIGTRSAERKWKNNTTIEQKSAINWKDYISTVDRNFKLEVIDKEGKIKEFVGENAEKSILLWFGQTVDNILFMNQTKIENLLTTASEKLNEIVLNFVGVDYINKLENNLDTVKNELMTVSKPLKSKDDLHNDIIDCKIKIEKLSNENILLDEEKTNIENLLKTDKEQKEIQNNHLLSIGNVPEMIIIESTEKNKLNAFLETFEEKTKKDKIIFNEIKPVLDTEKIFDNEKLITDIKEELIKSDEKITEIKQNINNLLSVDLEQLVNKKQSEYDNMINQYLNGNLLLKNNRKDNYLKIVEFIDTTIEKLEKKKEDVDKSISEYQTQKTTCETTIEDNKISIESGFCDKCNRAFSDDFESHKEILLSQNIELSENISKIVEILKDKLIIVDKIKKAISNYKNYRDYAVKEDVKIMEVMQTSDENILLYFDVIKKLNIEIKENIEATDKLILSKSEWDKTNKIVFENYAIGDILNDNELSSIINTHKGFCDLIKEETNLYNLGNKNINEIKEKISEINSNYNTALTNYQTLLEKNISDNNAIDIYNDDVIQHNNSKILKESEYSKILLKLSELENVKLVQYKQYKDKYDAYVIQITTKEETLEKIGKTIHSNALFIKESELKKINAETAYSNYLKYQKNQLVWKIYSKLIKNNFKEIVFEYYRTFLNSTLNVLLEDVNFKLFWNENSELYHVSYKNGKCSYQPVQQSSGMETSFLGLALVYTIHLLNVKNSVSHLFIDEISGTLNKGLELSYSADNYQELLVLILSKFKDKSIFIIDHNITNLFETVTYEVQPTLEGSKYLVV